MEYFNIIQALCRSAVSNPSNAVLHQIQRLTDALEKDGHNSEAKLLASLLKKSENSFEMVPSRIVKSFVTIKGEELSSKTVVPVDKESATPLAEIFFAADLPTEIPIFSNNVRLAVESVMTEWREFDKLLNVQAQPSSSCLIYGDPGTGKTHLAMWIANQLGIPVVLAKLDGLMSSLLGTTSRNIGNLFSFANKYRCVLLLDEFDAIAKLRNDTQEVGEIKRVVNTLLQNLDNRRKMGFTIGVTNHDSLLDPAIWRRFEVQIEIPKPSPEVMISLIKKFLVPLELDDTDVKFLAWCIENSSGADAEGLVKWLKKAFILEPKTSLIEKMRRFALLNSGRIDPKKRNILAHSNDDEIITSLLKDQTFSFKQKDVASIVGITPSSLSKQISKSRETEKL